MKGDPNLFYLKVYYSPTEVMENEVQRVSLFPNPADQSINIEVEGMTHVTVYNMLGQFVYDADVEGDMMKINVSDWNEGIYLIRIESAQGQLSRRVNGVFSTLSVVEAIGFEKMTIFAPLKQNLI